MLDTYVAQHVLAERKIAYCVTDMTLAIVSYAGDQSFYHDPEPILGRQLTDVTPEFTGYEEQLEALLRGDLPRLRLDLVNRENEKGELIYVTLIAAPYLDETAQIRGILHFIEDTTLLGETSQRLTQQHNDLYLLHQQLSAANLRFAAANAELQTLDELKSRFVSIAAHELRTPIATMLGYTDFMLHDEEELLSPPQRKSIAIIERSAQRLLTITSDLLDVTRLEAGRLELILESVNLPALVQAVSAEFEHEIAEKQLAFTFTTAEAIPLVICDEKRSIQILNNLISNAIKYTPNKGKITIHIQQQLLSATKQNLGQALQSEQGETSVGEAEESIPIVLFTISDSGIGIPAADLANMGKAFYRASNAHKARVSGTGLGLHITQSLCELQGGQLWIQSTEGKGTTFHVTFPIDDGIFDNDAPL